MSLIKLIRSRKYKETKPTCCFNIVDFMFVGFFDGTMEQKVNFKHEK